MELKTTRKLFRGAYQYKIVLICAGASLFRSGDIDSIMNELSNISIDTSIKNFKRNTFIKNKEDLDYSFKLAAVLSNSANYEIRIESPWVSIYTNDKTTIDNLSNICAENVKYISMPPVTGLLENTVIMPKMDYDYRITLGKTSGANIPFIEWASQNKKIKLTKSCIRDLQKQRSWGGTHFYITGNNNLLMAKMHLGGCISKVERIVKA
jgi:hypothetical protein